MSQRQPQRKRESERESAPYRQNKKAFDAVILYFKRMDTPMLKPLGAVNPEAARSRGSNYRNPLKPLSLDFYCDVEAAVKASLPKAVSWEKFLKVYFEYDSDSETERNLYAYKALGGRCHSVEQRVGAEFIRREIYPLKRYLNPPRPGKV